MKVRNTYNYKVTLANSNEYLFSKKKAKDEFIANEERLYPHREIKVEKRKITTQILEK